MAHVTYVVFQHDGGWAYRVAETISETYPTRERAHKAAEAAAFEQRAPGETTEIQFETRDGLWNEEHSLGSDRPQTDIKD